MMDKASLLMLESILSSVRYFPVNFKLNITRWQYDAFVERLMEKEGRTREEIEDSLKDRFIIHDNI